MKKSKRKALGQHFLANARVLQKIVKVINPRPEDLIIEIGAGKGNLTFLLAERAGNVIAIEKDSSLIPYLKRKAFSNLSIQENDILKFNFRQFEKKENVKVVGNLPYSISLPILFRILDEKEIFSECSFLLQKEVAERLCAEPGIKKYAPLSIIFQNYFSKKIHFKVAPESFSPPPKVESAFVSLKKRENPLFPIQDEEAFLLFLKAAFKQRRKKLTNNLKTLNFSPSQIRESLEKCGIGLNARSEQVSLSQFVELFHIFYYP